MSMYFILIIAFIFGAFAQFKLSSTYARTSKMLSSRGMTGKDMARYMLDLNGLNSVQVVPVSGQLTDHYDPRNKTVSLSEGVYNSPSIAAIGIAAHECGHAIQDSSQYGWLKIRNAIIPITNIGSKLSMPLILVGMLFQRPNLILIGIVAYALMTVFQLITLPVEFNASRRALQVIDQNQILVGEEYDGAKATLSAAAMTYVAALMASIGQLLYLVSLLGGRRRND